MPLGSTAIATGITESATGASYEPSLALTGTVCITAAVAFAVVFAAAAGVIASPAAVLLVLVSDVPVSGLASSSGVSSPPSDATGAIAIPPLSVTPALEGAASASRHYSCLLYTSPSPRD